MGVDHCGFALPFLPGTWLQAVAGTGVGNDQRAMSRSFYAIYRRFVSTRRRAYPRRADAAHPEAEILTSS